MCTNALIALHGGTHGTLCGGAWLWCRRTTSHTMGNDQILFKIGNQ